MQLGVDLSEHQAGFDNFAGFDFAVLRTTDGTYRDRAFADLLRNARAAGVDIAAYHYLRAPAEGTSVQAQVEASLEVLDGVATPMWLDVESPAGLSLADVHSAHHHFTQAGIPVAGVYTTAAYWRRHMLLADPAQFGEVWLASWRESAETPQAGEWPRPLGFPVPAMWQFTSQGRVGEFEVDLNLAR